MARAIGEALGLQKEQALLSAWQLPVLGAISPRA